MENMVNKRVLFISSNYFNYYKHIVVALTKIGASVDWFSDEPTDFMSRMQKLVFSNKGRIYDGYYECIKRSLSNDYDYILIIKGDLVPVNFLDYLKEKYNGAQFIMYHWDDIELFPTVIDRFKYFNRILSYNILDCQKFGLILRPIFFVPIQNINIDKSIDASIIGSYNSVRGEFIKQFKLLNPEVDLYTHYYINPLLFIMKGLNWATLNEFKFHKLSYNEMMMLVAKSKVCLDVPHHFQQGLTTRSVEAMPFQTKIITTNPNIKLYDYYSPVNHYIVDLSNPIIDKEWLDEPYEDIEDDIVLKYSIDYWVKDVFDLNL